MRTRSLQILTLGLLLSTLAFAQTPTTASADVSVSVVVTTRGDRAVTGLTLKDFRVFENGVPQPVVSAKENQLPGDYTITYTPANSARDGAWRRVKVEIANSAAPLMTLQHSQGYRAPMAGPR
jgi:hypothetical protein